eukprot:TRINITY_DN2538_c0_g2_i1.p1 TRINITY_DN2538_c0_g2~~TRINITY_DN2538_c0_g2_i1.p1  ORF type:complete len:1228 (-),score=321.39 TRINITY_DN2538_c0_g2_i1:100-3456(-)
MYLPKLNEMLKGCVTDRASSRKKRSKIEEPFDRIKSVKDVPIESMQVLKALDKDYHDKLYDTTSFTETLFNNRRHKAKPISHFTTIPSEYHKLVEAKDLTLNPSDPKDYVFLDDKIYERIFPRYRPFGVDQIGFLKTFIIERYGELPIVDVNDSSSFLRLLDEESDLLLNIVSEISRQVKVKSPERGDILEASVERLCEIMDICMTLFYDVEKEKNDYIHDAAITRAKHSDLFEQEKILFMKEVEEYRNIIEAQQKVIEKKNREIEDLKGMLTGGHDVTFEKVVLSSLNFMKELNAKEKEMESLEKSGFDELSHLLTSDLIDSGNKKELREEVIRLQVKLRKSEKKQAEQAKELIKAKEELKSLNVILMRMGLDLSNKPPTEEEIQYHFNSNFNEMASERLQILSRIISLRDEINIMTKYRKDQWEIYSTTKDETSIDTIPRPQSQDFIKTDAITSNDIGMMELSLLSAVSIRLTKKLQEVSRTTIAFKVFENLPIFQQYQPTLDNYKQIRQIEKAIVDVLMFNSEIRNILCKNVNDLPLLFIKYLRKIFWVRNSFESFDTLNLRVHEVFSNFLTINYREIVQPFLEECELTAINIERPTNFNFILFIRLNIALTKIFSNHLSILTKLFFNVICSSSEEYLNYIESLNILNPHMQLSEIKLRNFKSNVSIGTDYLGLIEKVESKASIFGSELIFPPLSFLIMLHTFSLITDLPYKKLFLPNTNEGLPSGILGEQFGLILKILFGDLIEQSRYKAIMKFVMTYKPYRLTSFQTEILSGSTPNAKVMGTNISFVPFEHCLLFILYEFNNVTLKQIFDFRKVLELQGSFSKKTYEFKNFVDVFTEHSSSISLSKLANIWMKIAETKKTHKPLDEYLLVMERYIDKFADGEFFKAKGLVNEKKAFLELDMERQLLSNKLELTSHDLDYLQLFEIILLNPCVSKIFALPLVNVGPNLVATIKMDEVNEMLTEAKSFCESFNKIFDTIAQHPTLLNRNFDSAKVFYEKLQLVLQGHSFPITTILLINKVINLLVSGLLEIQSSTGLYDFNSMLEVPNVVNLFDKAFNEGSLRALEYSNSDAAAFSVTQCLNSLVKLQRQYRRAFKKIDIKPNLARSGSLTLLTS